MFFSPINSWYYFGKLIWLQLNVFFRGMICTGCFFLLGCQTALTWFTWYLAHRRSLAQLPWVIAPGTVNVINILWKLDLHDSTVNPSVYASISERSTVWVQGRSLTLPSCVCGRSVSTGSSRSCVWRGLSLGGRQPGILLSGLVSRTERAQWSSSTNTLRRNTRCWLRFGERTQIDTKHTT